jgi:hypothetical protein
LDTRGENISNPEHQITEGDVLVANLKAVKQFTFLICSSMQVNILDLLSDVLSLFNTLVTVGFRDGVNVIIEQSEILNSLDYA